MSWCWGPVGTLLQTPASVPGRPGGEPGPGLGMGSPQAFSLPKTARRLSGAPSCTRQVTFQAWESAQPPIPWGSWHPSPAMGSPAPTHRTKDSGACRSTQMWAHRGCEPRAGPGALCHHCTERMTPAESSSPGPVHDTEILTGLGSNPTSIRPWMCGLRKSKLNLSKSEFPFRCKVERKAASQGCCWDQM